MLSRAPLNRREEILNWYLGTHFPIRRCAGQPVEYETIERMVSGR